MICILEYRNFYKVVMTVLFMMKDYHIFSSVMGFEKGKREIALPSRKWRFYFKRYARVELRDLKLEFPEGFPEPNVLVSDETGSFEAGTADRGFLGGHKFCDGRNSWAIFLYDFNKDETYLWLSSRKLKSVKKPKEEGLVRRVFGGWFSPEPVPCPA